MNINMSDFFKSTITTGSQNQTPNITENVSQNVVNSNNAAQAEGMKILNSLMTGDTFTGFVSQLKGDNALITMNNGASIQAKLAEGALVNVGQNVTFMVEQNVDNKISIKPVLANEQQAVLIDKALEAAGLSPVEENIDLVKELLGLGMPVDSETVGELARYSVKYPDASLNTIANLMRLDIPVTDNNIKEFQMYGEFNGQIDNLLQDMETGFINGLTESTDNAQVFNDIINTMYEGIDGENVHPNTAGNVLTEDGLQSLKEALGNAGFDDEFIKDIPDKSVKDILNKIMLPDKEITPEKFKSIINSKGAKQLIHAAFNDTFRLTPKDIQEGETAVSSYYKRIRKNVENIESSLKSSDSSTTELSKSLSDIKSNIDFMNDLNRNMTYFQMPVKFSKSEGNGELYVFTNKKNLANKSDNISAMLHLDMDNLKSMDIYVNLSGGNNVSTNFVLETEELLDFVYRHIDKLNARLEQLGYKTHFEMKVAESSFDRLDFVKDFIEAETRPATGGQYIFDAKA